ncbi:MAG: hypothetical protein OXQ89_07280 [Rhodospirillaceae bacterium]|nr:hypothetical protein [Rhodospirillaceae bacterium]
MTIGQNAYDQGLVAVVALVVDSLREGVVCRLHGVEHRLRVAGIRVVDADGDHRVRLQVHGMVELVR